jgi:hypothetical protein
MKLSGLGNLTIDSSSPVFKHVLSHQVIFAKFWNVRASRIIMPKEYLYVDKNQINTIPLPKLIECFMESKWNHF